MQCTLKDCFNPYPLVPHKCVSGLGQHWFRQWLVANSMPSHYLNQCWAIINWTLREKLQWNFNWNTKLCIHDDVFQNVVSENGGHFVQGRWVNTLEHTSFVIWCIYHAYGVKGSVSCSITGNYRKSLFITNFVGVGSDYWRTNRCILTCHSVHFRLFNI